MCGNILRKTLDKFSCQVDASAVNLRLQYSSYFLFVMVITCVLYGMIKGRPVKQNYTKKVHGPDFVRCIRISQSYLCCFSEIRELMGLGVDWFQ